MQQQSTRKKWLRGSIAGFAGLLLLAAVLPSTGGIIEGPARPGMSRCGPFLFYPNAFIGAVGAVGFSTACTVFGIARGNACEIAGWILLGVLFVVLITG